MKLSDCKKADLLWIIRRMCQYNLSDQVLQRALHDLEYEKEMQRLDQAKKLSDTAAAASRRYAALLEPYEGAPLRDVPIHVLEQGDAALAEARTANKRWAALIRISFKGGIGE